MCILQKQRGEDKSTLCNHCQKFHRYILHCRCVSMIKVTINNKVWCALVHEPCVFSAAAGLGFTCERALLCAATAEPLWCVHLSKPNGAASGPVHRLRSADESLWSSPVTCGRCWCAHTFKERARRRGIHFLLDKHTAMLLLLTWYLKRIVWIF